MKISVWSHRSNIPQSCDLDKWDLPNSKDHGPFQTPGCLPCVLCLYGVGGSLGAVYIFRTQVFLLPGSQGVECSVTDKKELHDDCVCVISEMRMLVPLLYWWESFPFPYFWTTTLECMYVCTHVMVKGQSLAVPRGPEGTSAHPCMCMCAALVALGF